MTPKPLKNQPKHSLGEKVRVGLHRMYRGLQRAGRKYAKTEREDIR